jgi:hypothetical protein
MRERERRRFEKKKRGERGKGKKREGGGGREEERERGKGERDSKRGGVREREIEREGRREREREEENIMGIYYGLESRPSGRRCPISLLQGWATIQDPTANGSTGGGAHSNHADPIAERHRGDR